MIEDLILQEMQLRLKTLPPLPPGWEYDFIPKEPKFDEEKDAWEITMEAVPRQKYIIKEE